MRLTVCLVAVLAITSYLVPVGDMGEVFTPLRGVLGGAANLVLALSLLLLNTKSVNNVFNPGLSMAFFLFFVLLNPAASYLSCIHPVVLLFVFSQYCFVSERKFASMFLMSCSALLYEPLAWVLPLVLVISVIGAADMLRVVIKSIGGILLPFVYVFCFRYMLYSDATVYMEEYISRAMEFAPAVRSVNFVSIFLLLCISVVSLHAISYMFRRLHSNSIITEHILRMEVMSLVLGVAVFFLFGGDPAMPVNMIAALPLAMILSHYFTGNGTAATAKGELVILCCAAAVSRLYHFI